MFAENIENAKMNLQGRVIKSFLLIVLSVLTFVFFALSSIFCLYFLIADTSFLEMAGVFNNQYLHAAICALAVIENIILLMLHIYVKLKKDIYFYFICDEIKISVGAVNKALILYVLIAMKKFLFFILFTLPFVSVFLLIIILLQHGISYSVLISCAVCDVVLLIVGLYSCAVYVQKYRLVQFLFIQNQRENICEIFSLSARLMNGKCKHMVDLKIINLPERLLCFLIIPAVYYLPYCKTVEADFISQKEKPYMRRKAYTEKPIVFYFKPVKEN